MPGTFLRALHVLIIKFSRQLSETGITSTPIFRWKLKHRGGRLF